MKGIAAFLKQEEGDFRLVLNDVDAASESENPNWNHHSIFTSKSYDVKSLKELSLSKEQYSEIGEDLIIRLLALEGLI